MRERPDGGAGRDGGGGCGCWCPTGVVVQGPEVLVSQRSAVCCLEVASSVGVLPVLAGVPRILSSGACAASVLGVWSGWLTKNSG